MISFLSVAIAPLLLAIMLFAARPIKILIYNMKDCWLKKVLLFSWN